MRITMVKKRLASGEPCPKCVQAERLLGERGLLPRIDRVVWADERDPESEGWGLSRRYGVDLAPFFVVEQGAEERVFRSTLGFVKEVFPDAGRAPSGDVPPFTDQERGEAARRLADAEPLEILRYGLERFGAGLVVTFSGAEDVALLELLHELGARPRVVTLDTGRLHEETLAFVERARRRYDLDLHVVFPDRVAVEDLVRRKGLTSFFEDGHHECCAIRKVEPLRRALQGTTAWATGQRRDQSPATRSELEALEWDPASPPEGPRRIKLNPFAAWTGARLWEWLRAREVPVNELHDRGYFSIGCAPCTRPLRPGEHERAARWWWEEATKRECGLHRE